MTSDMLDIVVENQGIELFGSTDIGWMHPEIYNKQHRDSIIIELCHTRSVNNIRIEFDSDRDGYIISQQTRFSWPLDDPICDPEWEEVAFVRGWAVEKKEDSA